MADNYPGLFDGGAGGESVIVNFIADEAIEIGGPVITVAAGTGELQARVEPSTDGAIYCIGVAVGGDANGIFVDGTTANDGNAAAAAGETVKVCTYGRCKVRVDGSTGGANSNIVVGDPLSIGALDEVAQKTQAVDYCFGRALQATSALQDVILCFVTNEGHRDDIAS